MTVLDTKKKPPPGPSTADDPIAKFNGDPYGYLDALQEKYGTIFSLPLGNVGEVDLPHIDANGAWVFLARPHQIKVMYEAGDETITGAAANKIFFGTDEASVAYIEGKAHRYRRQQLHPTFGGSRDYADLVLSELAEHAESWPKGTPFPLFDALQKLTSAVITEVVCGNMAQDDREFIRTTLLKTENAKYSREEILGADADIRALVAKRIPDYRATPAAEPDTLATLVKLADDGDESLTDDVLRDEVFSLLYTGFSTTANTLSWVFIRILDDSRVQSLLRKEIADNIGDTAITRDSVNNLPYLEAVLKETLRLHPVTALNGVRLLKRDIELDGYHIAAGSILVHCAYLLQRSTDVFDEPTEFRPERFMADAVDRYSWGAFGGGSRMCVGRGFSLNEMKLIVTKLLACYSMSRDGGVPGSQLQGFFMAPADGARLTIAAN
ncbi:MAG: cytochrome P450 [Actinomycetota bacterium]|nr:cytochrome P450 [Actinomycetota bacterium]